MDYRLALKDRSGQLTEGTLKWEEEGKMRKLLFAASAIGALILGVSGYVAAQDNVASST